VRAIRHTLALIGGFFAAAWVLLRRAQYRRAARPLTPGEREALRGHFDADLLERVRIACIPCIANPVLVRGLMPLGYKPPMDLRNLWGMAFIDTVVLCKGSERGGVSTLFHELVHIVQYQALGTRRFLSAYLLGWLQNGRDYWSIPDEVEAYTLTRRFNRGERFSVAEAVAARLSNQNAA
jgi:hypothetical protein